MIRKNIHLPEQMIKELKRLAKKEGVPFSEIVRVFIREGLERKSK